MISKKKLLSSHHSLPPSDTADTYWPNLKLFKSIQTISVEVKIWGFMLKSAGCDFSCLFFFETRYLMGFWRIVAKSAVWHKYFKQLWVA